MRHLSRALRRREMPPTLQRSARARSLPHADSACSSGGAAHSERVFTRGGACALPRATRALFSLGLFLAAGLLLSTTPSRAEPESASTVDGDLTLLLRWGQLALRGAEQLSGSAPQRSADPEAIQLTPPPTSWPSPRDRALIGATAQTGIGSLILALGGGKLIALSGALYGGSIIDRLFSSAPPPPDPLFGALARIERGTLEHHELLHGTLGGLAFGQRELAVSQLRAGRDCVRSTLLWPQEEERQARLRDCLSPLELAFAHHELLSPLQRLLAARLLVELHERFGAPEAAMGIRAEALQIPSQREQLDALWASFCGGEAPRSSLTEERRPSLSPSLRAPCAPRASWISLAYHDALSALKGESEGDLQTIAALREALTGPLEERPAPATGAANARLLTRIHDRVERLRPLQRVAAQQLRASFLFRDLEPFSRDDFRYLLRCEQRAPGQPRGVLFEQRGALATRRQGSALTAELSIPPLPLLGPIRCALQIDERDYLSPSDRVGEIQWTIGGDDPLGTPPPPRDERLAFAGQQPRFPCRYERNAWISLHVCAQTTRRSAHRLPELAEYEAGAREEP